MTRDPALSTTRSLAETPAEGSGDPPLLAILALASVVRLAVILPQIPMFPGLGSALDQYAVRVAAGWGFGPSALLPPLYAYFLAMLYRIYGYSVHPVVLSQAVLGALAVLPTMLLAKAAGLGRFRIIFAGILVALFPPAVAETRHLTPVLLVSLLLALAAWLWLRRGPLPGRLDTVLSGLLLGTAALGRSGMLVVGLFLAFGTLGSTRREPETLRYAGGPPPPVELRTWWESWLHRGLLLALAVLVLVPWSVRNSTLHRHPVLTETTWALRLRAVTVPGTPPFQYTNPAGQEDAPDNLVLTDNAIAFWETIGYALSEPRSLAETWTQRLGRFLSFGVTSDTGLADPFPYRRPWFRYVQAVIWGSIWTLTLAWLILLRGRGRVERALFSGAVGCIALSVLAGGTGDARILSVPLLAVPVARGAGALAAPASFRLALGRGRWMLFGAVAVLIWVHGFYAAV